MSLLALWVPWLTCLLFLWGKGFAQALWHLQYKMGEGGESLYWALSSQGSDSHVWKQTLTVTQWNSVDHRETICQLKKLNHVLNMNETFLFVWQHLNRVANTDILWCSSHCMSIGDLLWWLWYSAFCCELTSLVTSVYCTWFLTEGHVVYLLLQAQLGALSSLIKAPHPRIMECKGG